LAGSSLSKRYALGLIKAVKSEEDYATVKSQLHEFRRFLSGNSDFHAGLVTPMLSREQKMELLDVVTQGAAYETKTMNFLSTLVTENRVDRLNDILEVMDDLWLESRGIEKMQVSSAVAMDDAMKSRLQSKLESVLKKPVHLVYSLDPGLIAGVRIQRGSVAYDMSVAGNLRKLQRRIVGAGDGDGESAPVLSQQEL
jgi:F-type H+-transporting ATPase subunit delta